jgi:hypothetical protein
MKSILLITIFFSLTNNSFAKGYQTCHADNQGECCGEMRKTQVSAEKSYSNNCNKKSKSEYLADEILKDFKEKSENLIKKFRFSKNRFQPNKNAEIKLIVK